MDDDDNDVDVDDVDVDDDLGVKLRKVTQVKKRRENQSELQAVLEAR